LTLIELLVTLVILAILFLLALPSFTGWVRNNQIRSAADNLQNGIRVAQSEALRRSRVVVFYLTNAQPSLTATAVADGNNWAVRYVPEVIDTVVAPEPFVQGGTLTEVSTTVQIRGSAGITGLCFNAGGRLIAGDAVSTGVGGVQCNAATGTFDITQPTGTDLRPLRIDVDLGGRVRMCDPNRPANAPDGCRT
jgi:type IV fimbrial biogenesis protein FimT